MCMVCSHHKNLPSVKPRSTARDTIVGQVADRLFHHFTSEIDVTDLNGGKTQGKRKTTGRIPKDPDFEAKDGFQYLADTFPASPQFGCFFFGDLAAPQTLLGRLNFRGI